VSCSTRCLNCGRGWEDPLRWSCDCGGAFEAKMESAFVKPEGNGTIFQRYSREFPYIQPTQLVSLGETMTPLVSSGDVRFKLEYLLPTGSFKDRGSCALISALWPLLKLRRIQGIKEDSSGNAGASLAAYCAKAGLGCDVFVPKGVSGPKAAQMMAYGARLHEIPGTRREVEEAAKSIRFSGAYLGHVWHPYFRDGIRTIAYEIAEQSRWELPRAVFVPVSAGTLLLGIISGFQHLLESGIGGEMPLVVACQTVAVSPLYHALRGSTYSPPDALDTVADALVSVAPPLLERMVLKVKEVRGMAEAASERETLLAWKELARMGYYVEPSSAVAYACMKKLRERTGEDMKDAVVVLTGSGLKVRSDLAGRYFGQELR